MRGAAKAGVALALAAALGITSLVSPPAEAESTRTLTFRQMHTGETQTITFKRNGRFDSAAMKKVNYMLRDWRRNETTRMDPRLLDLVWEVQQATGSKGPIHVLSGYRSPVTNAMLRRRSRGVAKNSQHTLGKAMDFYLPDVPLAKLRATAMRMQRGGVGYYPTSGSPFVHLDVARVRAWPRMTRKQLLALFPNGETLHLPADGAPLPGYQRALARANNGRLAVAYNGSDDADDDEGSASVSGSRRNAASAIVVQGSRGDTAPVQARREAPATVAAITGGESWNPPSNVPMPRHKPGGDTMQIASASAVPLPPLRRGIEESADTPLTTASIPMPRRRPLISDAPGGGTQVAELIARENDALTALARSTPGDIAADPLSGPDARRQLAAALSERAEKMASDRAILELAGAGNIFAGVGFSAMAHPTRDDSVALMALHHPVVIGSFAGPVVVYARPNGFAGPAVVSVAARHVGYTAGPLNTAALR